MADLEELALKRDRGYLVRLVLLLAVAILAGAFLFAGLTGDSFATCVADVFVGGKAAAPASPEAPADPAAPAGTPE